MAGELVDHFLAELPVLAALTDRGRLLAAAWLASLRSARTRRSYAGDLLAWQDWLADRDVEVLVGGRVQMDMWVRTNRPPGPGTPASDAGCWGSGRSTATTWCMALWRRLPRPG